MPKSPEGCRAVASSSLLREEIHAGRDDPRAGVVVRINADMVGQFGVV